MFVVAGWKVVQLQTHTHTHSPSLSVSLSLLSLTWSMPTFQYNFYHLDFKPKPSEKVCVCVLCILHSFTSHKARLFKTMQHYHLCRLLARLHLNQKPDSLYSTVSLCIEAAVCMRWMLLFLPHWVGAKESCVSPQTVGSRHGWVLCHSWTAVELRLGFRDGAAQCEVNVTSKRWDFYPYLSGVALKNNNCKRIKRNWKFKFRMYL